MKKLTIIAIVFATVVPSSALAESDFILGGAGEFALEEDGRGGSSQVWGFSLKAGVLFEPTPVFSVGPIVTFATYENMSKLGAEKDPDNPILIASWGATLGGLFRFSWQRLRFDIEFGVGWGVYTVRELTDVDGQYSGPFQYRAGLAAALALIDTQEFGFELFAGVSKIPAALPLAFGFNVLF